MTNGEKYKGAKERAEAFKKFCDNECGACPLYAEPCHTDNCQFYWLDLEAPAEEPLLCPFCGTRCYTPRVGDAYYVVCPECCYRSGGLGNLERVIADHNRVARAAKEAN